MSATEGEWLELAARENTAALSFAIEVARRKNRKAPAKGRFGLPGTPVKIAFELAPEEHAIVEKARRKAAREAGAGRVEIEPGALERIERSAELVVLDEDLPPSARVAEAERDSHNTPQLRLQVSTRDGGRCSNPHCRREVEGNGQCHHIEFWSRGGRTAV